VWLVCVREAIHNASAGASERWRRWIETGGASEFVSDGSISARAQSPQGECQDVTRERKSVQHQARSRSSMLLRLQSRDGVLCGGGESDSDD
jgi:hypothetical protein